MAKFDKWLTDASADDRVSAAARRALRDRLKAVRHYLAAAKGATSREQEPVHQMRVWSRRASAALRMFRDLLPRRQSRKMQRVLRKIRQLGGDARDCDLLLLSLADEHTTSETVRIARLLKQRRKAAQKPIDRLHRKLVVRGKLKRRTKKLVRSIRWKGKARSEPNFRDWAAEQLSELMQAVFSFDSAMLQSDDQLHQLRIAGKRLRYAAELSAGAFPRIAREGPYEQLSDLQDRLGSAVDHLAAITRLGELLAEAKDRDQDQIRSSIDQHRKQWTAKKRKFLRWWTPARRRSLENRWRQAIRI